MNIEDIREYCLQKKAVTESFPFDENTLVFKVGGKIFLLINLLNPDSFNVKCHPERALTLREEFAEVVPGYHMNKRHWNTILLTGRLTVSQVLEHIDHSYEQVYKCLPKKIKEEVENGILK